MVPHFRAVDVASDNRLLPLGQWVTTHSFASPCSDPQVEAVLVHRPYPLSATRQYGWAFTEKVAATRTE
jgi:hypothetical protein